MAETASRWKGKGKSVFTSRLRKRASAAPEEDDANNNNNDKSAAKVEHSKALEANNNEKQKKKSQSQRTSPRVRIKEPEEASGQGVVVATSQQKTKRDASFLRRKFSRVLHSKASSSTSISTSREASAGPSSPRKAAAEPLFGVPLEVAALRSDPERGLVPSPLANAIAWLNKYGLKEKGLYRIPGSQTTFQHYKDMFDRGENVDFEALEEKVVENVAIVVIKYFKELPHSMFSSRLRPDFEVAAGITDEEEQLVKLKHIFPKMPLAFKETFRLLATHFNLIAEHAETNQMKPSVLGMTWGITFGPAVGNIVAVLAAHPVDELIPPSIVFGVELSEAAKRSDPEGLIPSPIRLPFALLHEQGCSEDVFRDGNADADALKQWKTVFNSEGTSLSEETLSEMHPSLAAAIIKAFIAELPSPIVIPESQSELVDLKCLNELSRIEQQERLEQLWKDLSPVQVATLKYIIQHWHGLRRRESKEKIVSEEETENREELESAPLLRHVFIDESYRIVLPLCLTFADSLSLL